MMQKNTKDIQRDNRKKDVKKNIKEEMCLILYT